MAPCSAETHKRRRGRPTVPWTPRRQRRLLRLYLLTPQSELSLDEILTLLREEGFAPEKRRAQQELQRLLSEQYHRLRPRDRAASRRRVSCLKSVGFRLDPQRCSPYNMTRFSRQHCRSISDTGANAGSPNYPTNEQSPDLSHDIPQPFLQHAATQSHDQQRRSIIRRILSSHYTPSRASEIASLFSLSPRSSFRSSLANSLRSLAARSSLESVSGLNRSSSLWSNLRTRREHLSRSRPSTAPTATEAETLELEDEARTNAAANSALLAQCCASTTDCIHQQLQKAIVSDRKLEITALGPDPLLFEQISTSPNEFGDGLLHVAARWGAPLTTLIDILRVLPAQRASEVNKDLETFLHLLDPNVISSTETFAVLIAMLKKRDFDFCRTDRRGRLFLTRLVTRPGLPWKVLAYLLLTGSPAEVRLWTLHNSKESSSPPLIRSIFDKQWRDSGNALGPALQCQYLLDRSSRYLLYRSCFELGIDHPSTGKKLFFALPTTASSEELSPLHHLIGSMSLYSEWHLIQKHPWSRRETSRTFDAEKFDDALKYILQGLQDVMSIDTIDPDTGQTPLMALLVEFGGSVAHLNAAEPPFPDLVQTKCVRVLLDAGASLAHTDHYGNAPLHYAAALGLKNIVKALIDEGAEAHQTNLRGFTPSQLAATSLKYVKDTGNSRSTGVHARYYEIISFLNQ